MRRRPGRGRPGTYATLAAETAGPKILVATCFDRLGDALPVLASLPVEGSAVGFTNNLPELPITTTGSFPQTAELRKARAALRAGKLDQDAYREAMRAEVRTVIAEQDQVGLDVLVHGEPERNDIVQYFGEQLTGFLATQHGWVLS